MRFLVPLALVLQLQAPPVQEPVADPALADLVQRFFATQEAEDAAAYLALWSDKAARPTPAQLHFLFKSGDDAFSDLTIERAVVTGNTARVRLRVVRTRTAIGPEGKPRTSRTRMQVALAAVREGGVWKLLREGSPADELAAALIDTPDAAARKALLDADPGTANARLVEAISRRAGDLAQKQQHRRAQAIYERSLEVARAIQDKRAEGQALQNVANSLYFQREFSAALALYEQRREIERELANEEGLASALIGIGTIQYSTADYAAALKTYREALPIQERLDDGSLVATTLISTGNVLYLQGDFEAAIADYRRAEQLKRTHFDLAGAATAREGLARVYSAQGDYASALSALAGVLDERRKRNDVAQQATALQSIGDIHLRLANLDAARAAFGEARTLFDRVKDLSGAGRALQGTAMTELVAGRFPAGEKAYADSVASCTAAGDPECVARAEVGLGFALTVQQKFRDAVERYRQGIEGFTAMKQPESVARAQIGLAEALSGGGEHNLALQQAINARQTAVGLNKDDVLWRALVSQARAERKLGRAAAALGSARAAVLTVRRMAAVALDRPLLSVPRDTTAAYAAAVVLYAEAGDPTNAFDVAEELRAHALRLWIAPHERDISRGMAEEERAEERRLDVDLTTVLARREREGKLPRTDAARIAELDRAVDAAVTARSAFRARLFARVPALVTARALVPAATSADLESLISEPSKAILSFVVDDHDVVIFSARRRAAGEQVSIEAHLVPLQRQRLGERIGRALDGTALSDADAWRTRSAELFGVLPASVSESLSAARHVLVVPDDLLWRVPFEAMPVPGGYLGENATLTYAPSIATVVKTDPPDVSAPPSHTLIVAAPQIPAPTVEQLAATAPSWMLRAGEVAVKEAEGIRAAMKDGAVVTLTGAGATAAAMRQGAQKAGALHIAAPFRLNSAGPLFSPVLLAAPPTTGASARASDGRFDLRDVFELSLPGAVVTLSDGAALSMREAAGALAPLHWAWQSAGASALVIRRWGGHDQLAPGVLRRFHEELRAGKPAAEALQTARASMRATAEGRAPAAWAGWLILSGRW